VVGETLTVIRDCATLSGAPGKAQSPRISKEMAADIRAGIRFGWANMNCPLGKMLKGSIRNF
jgi:hypothetical protein